MQPNAYGLRACGDAPARLQRQSRMWVNALVATCPSDRPSLAAAGAAGSREQAHAVAPRSTDRSRAYSSPTVLIRTAASPTPAVPGAAGAPAPRVPAAAFFLRRARACPR